MERITRNGQKLKEERKTKYASLAVSLAVYENRKQVLSNL